MYAKISNNTITEYPVSPYLENPNVSFAVGWKGGVVNDQTYVYVQNTQPPAANLGWIAVESTPIKRANNKWYQSWTTNIVSKEKLKQVVAEKRYTVEVGGVSVANNVYATDRESQTKYVAVAVDIQQSNTQSWSITWKTQDNSFVTLNASDMLNVISTVRNHVQSCFDKEAEYYQLIDSANTAVLESTDFSAGWPSNS